MKTWIYYDHTYVTQTQPITSRMLPKALAIW